MNRKNELRKSGIQRWLLVIAGLGSIGGLALSEPLAQQATSPPQAALASTKVPATVPAGATLQPQATNLLPIVQSYGKLPLSFEKNEGQTDSQVQFLSRGRGYTLFLTRTEAVLALRGRENVNRYSLRSPRPTEGEGQGEGAVLLMQLLGANTESKVTGLDKLPGIVNYFIGNDPKQWRTNVPTYKKVEYKEVYPGIDLAYYGNQGKLEYDLIVAPGADPDQIKLAFQGTEDVKVDTSGNLVLKVAGGEVYLHAPNVYQDIKGKRELIGARYIWAANRDDDERLKNKLERNLVAVHDGIQYASHDSAKPLIIDPVLFYSTYLGGSDDDRGEGIAVDAAGNAYVTGATLSTNFPTASPVQPETGGGNDAFVAKLNAAGSALVYSTYLGGSGNDEGSGIAVDAIGSAYVTGSTASANFPATLCGEFPCAQGGGIDTFVTKLGPNGSALVFSRFLGGSGSAEARGIAVDAAGNAYVTGFTTSADFGPVSPFQATLAGTEDAFVAKLSAAGGIVWSTYLGGSGGGIRYSIAMDAARNPHVARAPRST